MYIKIGHEQYQTLAKMRDLKQDLVFEQGCGWYIEHTQIPRIMAMSLIRRNAITPNPENADGEFERYSINEAGLKLLKAVEDKTPLVYRPPRPYTYVRKTDNPKIGRPRSA